MEFSELKLVPDVPYKKMYVTLFKAITAALYMIEDNEIMKARALLMQAQQWTEEMYIEGDNETSPEPP